MSDNLEVLALLEPHTTEIMSVVVREQLQEPSWNPQPWTGIGYKYGDFVARVDGDDYIVTVADAQMTRAEVERDLRYYSEDSTYATNTRVPQLWVARKQKIIPRITSKIRPRQLFKGHVSVAPRDAYDIHETNNEIFSNGLVGHTLRHGQEAILYATSGILDDPEFFLRAVKAARLDDPIDQKTRIEQGTRFTASEQIRHSEIYRPIIDLMDRLIRQDGLPPMDALQEYADKYVDLEDMSTGIAVALDVDAKLEPAIHHKIRSATYRLGDSQYLLITRRSEGAHQSINVTHEFIKEGALVTRRYKQPWGYPDLLISDEPLRGLQNKRNYRLFVMNDSDALDLNSVLTSLLR